MDQATSSPPPTPAPEAVRDQLERVLGSAAFANAGRHSRLLRYVVERTLAGEGDQLKEYVLGTEVFDRQDSYDPRLDSIVRVEARRLRTRLEDYYRHAGANDLVVISIPRGSYAPVFLNRGQAFGGTLDSHVEEIGPLPDTNSVPDRPRPSWTRSFVVFAGALAVIVAVIVVALKFAPAPTPAAHASRGPSIAVLPFHHYSASQDESLLAARLTDAVTTELARLGTVSIASRTSAAGYEGERRPAPEIAKSLNVDFLLEATSVLSAGTLEVTARIVDASIDRKVWVGEYSLTPSQIPTAARTIAAEAAAGTLKYASTRMKGGR
jgi:TolB-like protein